MTVPGPSVRGWQATSCVGPGSQAGLLQVIPEPLVVAQECLDLAAKPIDRPRTGGRGRPRVLG